MTEEAAAAEVVVMVAAEVEVVETIARFVRLPIRWRTWISMMTTMVLLLETMVRRMQEEAEAVAGAMELLLALEEMAPAVDFY